MRNVVALGVLSLAALLSLASSDDGASKKPNAGAKAPPAAAQPAAPEAPPIEVTSAALVAAYHGNEIGADAKYKGRTVILAGIVESIGKDFLGQPYVTTLAARATGRSVQCMFASEKGLGDLAKGDEVRLRGRVLGMMVNVILENCVLEQVVRE